MKRLILTMFVVSLIAIFAAPGNGLATLIETQTEVYNSDLLGTPFVQVDVAVWHGQGDDYDGYFDVDFGDQYLYQYKLTNVDETRNRVNLRSFALDLSKATPVSQIGAALDYVTISYDNVANDIHFFNIYLREGSSTYMYIVSSAEPELVPAWFSTTMGGASDVTPRLWAPDPPPNGAHVPEPTTLLLVGTGLVGLAGLRRRTKK